MIATKYHSLRRTSPSGQNFIGTCYQCGKTDLPMSAVHEYCENTRNLTQAEALIEAIEDDD
jgi:hypothetical protein